MFTITKMAFFCSTTFTAMRGKIIAILITIHLMFSRLLSLVAILNLEMTFGFEPDDRFCGLQISFAWTNLAIIQYHALHRIPQIP